MRELYIYYRVPAAAVEAVLMAATAMQRHLCERHPGLQARLLRRPEAAPDGQQTWMETYALPGRSVDASLQLEIEAAAEGWAALIHHAPRHCEVFEPCA